LQVNEIKSLLTSILKGKAKETGRDDNRASKGEWVQSRSPKDEQEEEEAGSPITFC